MARNSKDPQIWIEAKSQRNLVADTCKKAKTDHIKTNITQNQNNPKSFWNEINKVWSTSERNSRPDVSLIDPGDSILKSGADVSNIFKKYFSKVGENLYHGIKPLDSTERRQFNTHANSNKNGNVVESTFRLRPITLKQYT